MSHHVRPTTPELTGLTCREREVLQLLALGLPLATIGLQLGISRRTVDSHCRNIRRTLNLSGRASLAFDAAQWRPVKSMPIEDGGGPSTTPTRSSAHVHRNDHHGAQTQRAP